MKKLLAIIFVAILPVSALAVNVDLSRFSKDNSGTNAKLAQVGASSVKGNASTSTANAADLNNTQVMQILQPMPGLVDVVAGDVETVADKTYVLDQSAKYAYTINNLTIATASGTVTVALKINGTNVTSISAVSVSSTPTTATATAANSVVIGDKVTLVTSATATALDMGFSIKITR